jgi:hypothetical protein
MPLLRAILAVCAWTVIVAAIWFAAAFAAVVYALLRVDRQLGGLPWWSYRVASVSTVLTSFTVLLFTLSAGVSGKLPGTRRFSKRRGFPVIMKADD